MLAVYALVVVALAIVAFIVWPALYMSSQFDERLELTNEDKLRKRSEKLREEMIRR